MTVQISKPKGKSVAELTRIFPTSFVGRDLALLRDRAVPERNMPTPSHTRGPDLLHAVPPLNAAGTPQRGVCTFLRVLRRFRA